MPAAYVFFTALLVFKVSPFETLSQVPSDGQGLNPLLRHPAMMIHPPMLYSGYTLFAVPFAFAVGALIAKRVDAEWIRSTRRLGGGVDQPVLDQAIARRTPTNTWLVTGFTHLGGAVGMTIIASLITIVLVWRWRSRTPLILMLLAVAGSLAMTTVGKAIVGRNRPPLSEAVPPYEYAYSFPSGHALNSTVIAGIIAYLLVRRLRSSWARVITIACAVVWAVAMGLSRVFLGHHWLTDVVFGWLVGAAWVVLLITAHRLFLTIRRARIDRRSWSSEERRAS